MADSISTDTMPGNEDGAGFTSDVATYDKWRKDVVSSYKHNKEKFDKEAIRYIQAYRHEFEGILPERLLTSDRVDVNIVYQIVTSLLPSLYFKNPKVFIKSEQEKIYKVITETIEDFDGTPLDIPITDPNTGQPMRQEYDGPRSALILQSALNQNILKAGLKREVKTAIKDALLTFYGAIKEGWGNDQGVASMGEGAPPSIREEIYDDSAYAVRVPPWDVVVDPCDFNNPEWMAIRYVVKPSQLKNDTRLAHTDEIKGVSKVMDPKMNRLAQDDPKKEVLMTEYFEVFVKPCADYPQGKYFMFTEEIKTGFMFESEWPTKAKKFPIKLLYFNSDPQGGLPIPEARYFYGQQKAKLNLRNALYEWVQRTLPALYLNEGGMKNAEQVKKQIQSGQMPRVITGSQSADKAFGSVSFPVIPADFHRLDAMMDNDVARVTGQLGSVAPANAGDQLATGLKIAATTEQVRQQERADCVSDLMQEILEYWVDLYKEYAGPDNYALIEGETFPTQWGKDEIQGKFNLEVKPFSMAYEDPVILRRQWQDLINLYSSPELRMSLQQQGYEVDLAKMSKRMLETFDERDVETFIYPTEEKPEMQVMDALKENEAMAQGMFGDVAVLPTDNHKIHILLHSLVGDISTQHILEHQAAMQGVVGPGGSPGGGNPEGLPLNGNAVNQEMMSAPLNPSASIANAASNREASKPTKNR